MSQGNSPKKEMLVQTGDRLFSMYGLRKVTVEEICREAGVSKVTFYKYFPNKLELFKQIWTGWSDSIYERQKELEESGATFKDRMQAIIEAKMELLSKFNPQLIEDVIHAGPEMEEFIGDLRARTMREFVEFVADARKKGEMRDIRPEFLIAVLNGLAGLVESDDLRRLYPTDMEFFRELQDFFFFGIMPVEAKTEAEK
jgi:AcrR family transcriptional regulator